MTDPRDPIDSDVDESSEESFPASDAPGWTNVIGVHASAPAETAPVVENNTKAHRFEFRTPEGVAELRYRQRRDGTLVLIHTEVPRALGGRGIAGKLAQAALEHARRTNVKIVPRCPFVAAFLQKHPEFQDLVVADAP